MSQIRPITEGEIEACMALKKNAYPALEIDSALNREQILQGIRDPSFPAVYGLTPKSVWTSRIFLRCSWGQ
jgi:hypothetical protein